MSVGDSYVFPGFLTLVLTQLSFQSHRLFFTCFSRGESWKYVGKKVYLNRVLNSQLLGHESDTLTTEPPRRGCVREMRRCWLSSFFSFSPLFPTLCKSKFIISTSLIYCLQMLSIGSLNPFPNKPWFLRVCSTSPFKTLWEKEKLCMMSNFSFSPRCFYLFGKLSAIFIKFEIVVCLLFHFGRA